MKPPFVKRRCAVYTRKSTEEGLDMAFNSLDAQREACEAYVQSQKAEGWILVPDRYDDGGFSGGNLERPALKRLLADIEAGRVDVVVVYKIDRLSRRLTLNVLLSFAQFEREVIGERIRDKIAASKRRGMWMGGYVPLGYDVVARQLVINPAEAETISMIFRRFAQLRSAVGLIRELRAAGIATKSGRAPDKVCCTSCCATGCTSARSSIAAPPIPVSTKRSSRRHNGSGCMPSSRRIRAGVVRLAGRRRRPCSRGWSSPKAGR